MSKVTQAFIDALSGRDIPRWNVVEADGTWQLAGNLDPEALRLLLFARALPDGSFEKRGKRYVLRARDDGTVIAVPADCGA